MAQKQKYLGSNKTSAKCIVIFELGKNLFAAGSPMQDNIVMTKSRNYRYCCLQPELITKQDV